MIAEAVQPSGCRSPATAFRVAAVQMVSGGDVAANLASGGAADRDRGAPRARDSSCCPSTSASSARARPTSSPCARPTATARSRRSSRGSRGTHGIWLVGGTVPVATRRSRAGAQQLPRVRTRRHARRALRQDPPVRVRARRRELRRGAHDRARHRRRWRSTCRAAASACRCATTCAFPSSTAALGELALILVPSAFTATTGAAHWHLLLRARAVENQCYVLAAAQGGAHPNGRRTYGHSVLIDPWGTIVAEQDEGPGDRRRRHRSRRVSPKCARNCPRSCIGCCDRGG